MHLKKQREFGGHDNLIVHRNNLTEPVMPAIKYRVPRTQQKTTTNCSIT